MTQAIGLVMLALLIWRFFNPITAEVASFEFTSGTVHRVVHVVDGDTLELEGSQRVRLIGIDTPEYTDGVPEPFANEATRFSKDFLADGVVELQFDRQRLDRFNRILAYAWKDGRMLNEELVKAGLATAELQYDYRSDFKRRFEKAETQAKSDSLGIWRKNSAAE